jgi:transcriptional regulator with XRE-family HTH domain
MKFLKKVREQTGRSQRQLAQEAGVAFRTIQLLEKGAHDPRISTLEKITKALGYSTGNITRKLRDSILSSDESIRAVSEKILAGDARNWRIWLFNFVDAFRRSPDMRLVWDPPVPEVSLKMRALLAAVVEALCFEQNRKPPWWCEGTLLLPEPWFIAEVENLKATALQESPVWFRKRNIFVLNNFLERI